MCRILGIDCGKDGYLSIVENKTDLPICHSTPTLRISKKSQKRDYDVGGMVQLVKNLNPDFCVIEKQWAFPGQGIVSTGSTMYGFGLWEGIISGLEISHYIVHPKTWQAKWLQNMRGDDTKTKSISFVKSLFPTLSLTKTDRCSVAHSGKADSILIALWGLDFYQEKYYQKEIGKTEKKELYEDFF